MSEYSGLAKIYDTLMLGVDYGDWARYIQSLTEQHGGIPEQTALDVACGTGSTTLALARAGFTVTGLDLAPHMLTIAREKAERERARTDFLEADMRDFFLPDPVGLVVSFQDGLNYLLTPEDFAQTFTSVSRALLPGGLFIFDINRVEKLKGTKTEVSWVESEEFTLIWETRFIRQDTWEINITGFVPTENGLYRKFSEVHRERIISEEEVHTALQQAGLTLVGTYAAFSLEAPDEETRRVFYTARKL
jgi:ubiquinone/menaquinone biosynthesis C-methylase UbiE